MHLALTVADMTVTTVINISPNAKVTPIVGSEILTEKVVLLLVLMMLMCNHRFLQASFCYWTRKEFHNMKPRWCKEHEDWTLYLFSPENP